MTQQVSARVIIDMPRARAWDKLRDISLAHHYVPGIVRTEIVTEQREGVGASRYVYRNERTWIQETVTEWHEGEGFVIRLHRGEKPAPPFRNAWFRYHLEDNGPEQTRFTPSMTYEMPWGGLGRWLEKRMVGIVESTIRDVAIAMKLYYETGVPTTPQALRDYKAQRR